MLVIGGMIILMSLLIEVFVELIMVYLILILVCVLFWLLVCSVIFVFVCVCIIKLGDEELEKLIEYGGCLFVIWGVISVCFWLLIVW